MYLTDFCDRTFYPKNETSYGSYQICEDPNTTITSWIKMEPLDDEALKTIRTTKNKNTTVVLLTI